MLSYNWMTGQVFPCDIDTIPLQTRVDRIPPQATHQIQFNLPFLHHYFNKRKDTTLQILWFLLIGLAAGWLVSIFMGAR
jgi:hypothetical protein